MGKPTPSAPQAPDPTQVANASSRQNTATAAGQAFLNNVNQVTPYGSLNYTEGPWKDLGGDRGWVPTFTATQTLSPEQQKIYDSQTKVTQGTSDLARDYISRISDATAKPFNYDGLPGAPTFNQDYLAKATQGIIDRNQPQMDRDRSALEQRLANQGVSVGTPAYQAAMDQYERSVNDFRLGAQNQGLGMAAQEYGLEGSTRDRAIAEMSNVRSQPINEVAALLGTGNGVRDPTFVNTPQTQIAPTDVMGAYQMQQQAQQQQYQQQMQANNATTGGLFGLGSAALGAWGLNKFKSPF